MIRIYLDTNIFSGLRLNSLPKYQKLNDFLNNYRNNLLVCYSHAHLLDLQRDKTDLKLSDLKFMEIIVEDNYLYHEWGKSNITPLIASPIDAFLQLEEGDSLPIKDLFNNVIKTLELLGDSGQDLKYQLENLQLFPPINIAEDLPEDAKKILSILLPMDKGSVTLKDWFGHFANFYETLFNNGGEYKDIRRYLSQYIGSNQFDINISKIDFNEDLKNTPIQKTFLQFVNDSLKLNNQQHKIDNYDFHIQAFTCLNLLGIDKESNKKAKFVNTHNDAQHSYYGSYCDYLISDDEGFVIKSKALYNLLGIKTKVLFSNELSTIPFIDKSLITIDNLIDALKFEIKTGLIVNTYTSLKYDRTTTTIKLHQLYFDYFNHIDIIEEKQKEYIVLYNNRINYSEFYFYKELQKITNKLIQTFGLDYYLLGEYSITDSKELENNNWSGRVWKLDEKATIILEINKGVNRISLFIELS